MRVNVTSKIYLLDSFQDFTKAVLVVDVCLVILFATFLLVAKTIFMICLFTFLQPSGNQIFSLCTGLLTEVVPLFP